MPKPLGAPLLLVVVGLLSVTFGCSRPAVGIQSTDPETQAWASKKIEENWENDNYSTGSEKETPKPLDENAVDVKGHKLTMSLKAFRENALYDECRALEGRQDLACFKFGLERGQTTFAGAPADITFLFVCDDVETRKDCRLYRVRVSFESSDYLRVADAMNLKFGEPRIETSVEMENRMGAKFVSRVRKWTKENVRIEVEERGSRVDEGDASFLYVPLLTDVEKGRKKGLRPDDI